VPGERPGAELAGGDAELTPQDIAPSARMVLSGPNGLMASLLLNGAAPYFAYQLLTRQGVSPVRALALTAVFPVLGLVLQGVRTRRADGIALISLVVIAIGIAGSLITGDPRFYLVRVSFGTAAFGLTCLASLLFRRPLLFYLGRATVAGSDARRAAYFDGLWAFPEFRRVQRVLTVTWGVCYLLEAAARVAIALWLPTSTVLVLEPLLGYGVLVGLLAWTLRYSGARARARASGSDSPPA
jgi:hypothetical protein